MNEIDEAIAKHPYILNIERIARMVPKMTVEEREALTEWAEEALESAISIDTSTWPGWHAVARRLCH
jgi:hypothetical protein